jgi:hypothetical protein
MSEQKTTFDDLKAASVPWTFNSDVKVRVSLLLYYIRQIQLTTCFSNLQLFEYLTVFSEELGAKTKVRMLFNLHAIFLENSLNARISNQCCLTIETHW